MKGIKIIVADITTLEVDAIVNAANRSLLGGGGGHNERELLASCYDTAMRLAEENHLKSIAFSCISTGVYGFPKAEAARIATRVLNEHLQNGYDGEIIVCCFTESDAQYYQ
jgi:O-acetyl-ADP-ribose deacetylase (regulator of RNase III)